MIGVEVVAVVRDAVASGRPVGEPSVYGAGFTGVGVAVHAMRAPRHDTGPRVVPDTRSSSRVAARIGVEIGATRRDAGRAGNAVPERSAPTGADVAGVRIRPRRARA